MKTVPLKRVVGINLQTLPETTEPGFEFRYVDIGAVSRGQLNSEPEATVFASAPSRARRLVRQGDTIISTVRTYLRAVWPVRDSATDLVVSTGFAVLTPTRSIDSRYLGWLIQSDVVVEEVVAHSAGVSYPAINPSDIGTVRVPLPPLARQRAIADYLDRETARIDALIEKKQRMISLLEERWATLRRDLTGIGTSRRWDSVQLRRVARLQAGAAFPHEYQGDPTGTIQYVKVGDLASIDGDFRLQGAVNRVTSDVAALLRSPVLPVGTIVLPKIGAALLTNRRAILSEPSCLDQNVMGVTVYEGEPVFVFHALASIDLGELSTPGPVPLLNEDAALSVRIPWPSVGEQRQLVEELNQRRAAILAPSAAIDRQILLLADHRQALITAAVTGGLEIRGVAA